MNKYKPINSVHFTVLSTRAFEMLIHITEQCAEEMDTERGCSRCSRKDKCLRVWDYIVDHTVVLEEDEGESNGVEQRGEDSNRDLGS
jgi:hypothetical protein